MLYTSTWENWGIATIATTSQFFFLRLASNEGRLADGLSAKKLFFFCSNRTQWHSPLLTLPGTWHRPTATTETKFNMLLNILDISHLNNVRDADSSKGCSLTTSDDATVSAPNHRSRASSTAFRLDPTSSRHDSRSAITGPASILTAPQRLISELCRTASAAVTAVFKMLIPVSEKKFLCVNRGWRIESYTHVTAPITCLWSIATPLRDTVKMGCTCEGQFTTNAVNRKIWNQNMC